MGLSTQLSFGSAPRLRFSGHRLVLGQDIFGRDATFKRVEIDATYPEYLVQHISDYQHLVMPVITPFSRLYHKLDLTVGRFFRKAFRKVKRMLLK